MKKYERQDNYFILPFCVLSINNYITVAMLVPGQNGPRCFILGLGGRFSTQVSGGRRHDVDIQARSEFAS